MYKNLNPSILGISGQPSEIIELALNNGFAGIDLNVTEFAGRVKLKGMPYAKRLLVSSKLRVSSFDLPVEWDTDDAFFQKELKKLSEFAQYAAEVGCTRATAIVAPAGDIRPYHENFEFHRQRLGEIGSVLQASGVRLAVGFRAAEYYRRNRAFQFIHDLDALVLLLNMVSAPNVGLLLDSWEVVACGGGIDSVRKLQADQILAVQVADVPSDVALADLDDTSRLLPGAENSRGDTAEFLAVLREIGYDGPVTACPSRSLLQGQRREAVVKQTAEALAKIWS